MYVYTAKYNHKGHRFKTTTDKKITQAKIKSNGLHMIYWRDHIYRFQINGKCWHEKLKQ